MFDKIAKTAQFIHERHGKNIQIGIILGSGLGNFVERIQNPNIIPYCEIPGFHETTVEGHEGRLLLGEIEGKNIAVLQGRIHAYEGYPMEQIVFPTRVLSALGVEQLILTNAAGGVNLEFNPGDLVKIEDHINMMGQNPLIGPNNSEFGPRFPDMTNPYNETLRNLADETAREYGFEIKSGVYAAVLGPTYETKAEVKMIRTLGADMVGMSTVPECIAAHHLGVQVMGLSCITNMAAGVENKELKHEEIKVEAKKVMDKFSNLLCGIIKRV